MKAILLFLLALTFNGALASSKGHDAGNGGYTVQCDHALPAGQKYELLDYQEARTKFPAGQFTIDLGGQGTEWDRVRFVLTRLARLDPKRAADYQERADRFEANTLHVTHVDMPNSNDLGAIWIETGCHTVGTALQFQTPLPGQRKYMISDDVYSQMGEDAKAGLILHEILYGDTMLNGATTSVTARYFNAVISSKQISAMSPDDYEKAVGAAGLVFDDHHNPLWTNDPIILPGALANTPFTATLVPFVLKPDGQALTFRKVDGPDWLTVSSDGTLSGSPSLSDVGQANFHFSVQNDSGYAGVEAVILVTAPQTLHWIKDPIDLGIVFYNQAASFDLTPFLHTDDGSAVTFSMLSGPSWLSLSANGKMMGTPTQADVGASVFQVRAQDSLGRFASVKVQLTVASAAMSTTDFNVKANQVRTFTLNASGEHYTYSALNTVSFMTLTADGQLTLAPKLTDIGSYLVQLVIKSPTGAVISAAMKITVKEDYAGETLR